MLSIVNPQSLAGPDVVTLKIVPVLYVLDRGVVLDGYAAKSLT